LARSEGVTFSSEGKIERALNGQEQSPHAQASASG
jgi:hypothetical protein